MTQKLIDHAVPLIRAVVIHPDGRSDSPRLAEERLEEAVGLARALDLDVRGEEIVRVRKVAPATLFGSGKVDELAALVRAAEAEAVVVDDQLTPVQQRNLEKAWDAKVIDRTGLILEIFGRRWITSVRAWCAPGPTSSASAAAPARPAVPGKPRSSWTAA